MLDLAIMASRAKRPRPNATPVKAGMNVCCCSPGVVVFAVVGTLAMGKDKGAKGQAVVAGTYGNMARNLAAPAIIAHSVVLCTTVTAALSAREDRGVAGRVFLWTPAHTKGR